MDKHDMILLSKIERIHTSLEGKIESHETTFEKGRTLIEEKLKKKPAKGYDNEVKDSLVVYIDEILTELYHIEGNERGPFREYFRTHVVMDDVERFKEQNAYLKNWVEFASASGIIAEGIALSKVLGKALDKLNDLADYVSKGKRRINDQILVEKANVAYGVLYSLTQGDISLRAYALENFHTKK